jgi:hypothetical protein
MGLFKNITKALKSAAPIIGGTIGFGLTGTPIGAAIGSGIGGLAAGQDVEEALKTAAIGGALGYGASKMGATPFLRGTQTATAAVTPSVSAIQGGVPVDMMDSSIIAQDVAAAQAQQGGGILSALGDLSTGQKIALGAAGLGTLGLLGMTEEEEEAREQRPFPEGELFDFTARSRETGDVYQLNDPEDLADYRREISDFNYKSGGSVDTLKNYTDKQLSQMSLNPTSGGQIRGPGTGTSDSVMAGIYNADGSYEGPARLSDGEFVITEKAMVGAGGGDRDIGAARMYDMMAELEAQA